MTAPDRQPVFAMDVGGTAVKSGLVWPDSRVDHVGSRPVNSHGIADLDVDCVVIGGGASPAVAKVAEVLDEALRVEWALAELGTQAALLGTAHATGSG